MLIPTCRSPMGNDWWNSVVIHNRNVLWMLSDSVIVSSISWQKSRLRWQFCSRSHFPVVMASVSSLRACASCPWPMEIDRISARGTSHVSGDEGRFREAEFLVMDFFFLLLISYPMISFYSLLLPEAWVWKRAERKRLVGVGKKWTIMWCEKLMELSNVCMINASFYQLLFTLHIVQEGFLLFVVNMLYHCLNGAILVRVCAGCSTVPSKPDHLSYIHAKEIGSLTRLCCASKYERNR